MANKSGQLSRRAIRNMNGNAVAHHLLHFDLLERREFTSSSLEVEFASCVVLLAIIADALGQGRYGLLVYFLEDLASARIA